jgi:hypothetical protein
MIRIDPGEVVELFAASVKLQDVVGVAEHLLHRQPPRVNISIEIDC